MQWIAEAENSAVAPSPVAARSTRRERAIWVGIAIAAAAGTALATWRLTPAPAVPGVTARFVHQLPPGLGFSTVGRRLIAISPDGTRLAYIANRQIYLRGIGQIEGFAGRPPHP